MLVIGVGLSVISLIVIGVALWFSVKIDRHIEGAYLEGYKRALEESVHK